jgi:hypothetical protein
MNKVTVGLRFSIVVNSAWRRLVYLTTIMQLSLCRSALSADCVLEAQLLSTISLLLNCCSTARVRSIVQSVIAAVRLRQ